MDEEDVAFVQAMRDKATNKPKLIIDSLETSPEITVEPLPEQFDEDFMHFNISIDVKIEKRGCSLNSDILSSVGNILLAAKPISSCVSAVGDRPEVSNK